jgi:hypothetical protein
MSKLRWQEGKGFHGFMAETEIGSYLADDLTRSGGPGYAASFRPLRGRSLLPKDRQPLGHFDTMEKAKARCEQHYETKGGTGRRWRKPTTQAS